VITVQIVSKPIAPPWNDATKCVAHALLSNRQRCAYRFFGTPESKVLEQAHVRCDVVSTETKFQPSFSDHARTLLRLMRPRPDVSVYHCLFTPNPRTSLVLKGILRAKRRPIVHTLCSSPVDWPAAVRLLFADMIITVSAWAKARLEEHGVRDVIHIPPGIDLPVASEGGVARLADTYRIASGTPCVLFSGDYEYSQAHDVILKAIPEIIHTCPDTVVIFACRAKTPHSAAIEASVREYLSAAGLLRHVRLSGEVADFPSLLALATVVIFPVQSLLRKMDIPLTLLQALALRRPIITSTLGPLMELLDEPIGIGVPPGDHAALAAAVTTLLEDESKRHAMGQAGHELVKRRYSSATMASAYETLYASL
jgi:glycosyltransferase involved in cell wall biosynthesis